MTSVVFLTRTKSRATLTQRRSKNADNADKKTKRKISSQAGAHEEAARVC